MWRQRLLDGWRSWSVLRHGSPRQRFQAIVQMATVGIHITVDNHEQVRRSNRSVYETIALLRRRTTVSASATPTKIEPRWWLPREHRSNIALGTVFGYSVPAATESRLEYFCLQRRLTDVMLPQPLGVDPSRKYLERVFGGCADVNFLHYRCNAGHS